MWFLDKAFLEQLDLKAYDASFFAQKTGVDLQMVKDFVSPEHNYMVQSNHYYMNKEGEVESS